MDKLRDTASKLYKVLVLGNQKAIIAWVLAFVTSLGVQVEGLALLDASVEQVIVSVVTAALSATGVWLQPNKK